MNIYVVIVTYNGEKWISRCLNSLTKYKIIVIDNNSQDDTLNIIESNFKDVGLIKSDKNIGFGAANNIGIKQALNKGADYIFLINQDVYVKPDTISNLISLHQKNPNYGIISPIHLDGKGEQIDYNFSTYLNANNCENFLSDLYLKKTKEIYHTAFINAACWMISKDCLQKVGLFDDLFFHYGEDRNYCQRVIYHGFKIGIYASETILHDRENRKSVHPDFKGLRHYLNETTVTLTDIRKSTFRKDFNRVFLLNFLNLLGSIFLLNTKKIKERCKIISYLLKNRTRMKMSILNNRKLFNLG
jgi:GT2 family glycosyltransferase